MEKEDAEAKWRLFAEIESGGMAHHRLGLLLQWLLLPLAKGQARWRVTVVQNLSSPAGVTV